MNNSRSKNAVLNIIVGWGAQVVILLLSFVSRKIFLNFLSIDYLGINGLYGNILSALSLAELGLGTVTQFFLYKPVAENDYVKITLLTKYFRKLYLIIASIVIAIGLLMIPLLPFIIDSELKQVDLIVYYVIFLFNSCATYLCADKIALLAANQDTRLTKYVSIAVSLGLQILHIIVLLIWKNYIVYVLATLLSSLVNAIVVNYLCKKKYPFLKEKNDVALDVDKKIIWNKIKSTFVYKIGAVILTGTDNILISVMVNTAAVGLYSNYLMIFSGVQMFFSVVTTALISGVGNLSANENKERIYQLFNFLSFIYQFVAAFVGTALFFLYNDFITVWLGEAYLLDELTVFAIAFSFYLTNAISPIWMYREANGLFNEVKYLFLIMAGLNIVFSVVLGFFWGTFGILLATSLARIVSQVWYEPRVLFRKLFNTTAKTYFIKQVTYVLISLLCIGFCYVITVLLPHSILFFFIKGILFFLVFLGVFWIFIRKSNEINELKLALKKIFKKKEKKS